MKNTLGDFEYVLKLSSENRGHAAWCNSVDNLYNGEYKPNDCNCVQHRLIDMIFKREAEIGSMQASVILMRNFVRFIADGHSDIKHVITYARQVWECIK